MFLTNIQGTVLIISRDPLCENGNVRFTILPALETIINIVGDIVGLK